MFQFPNITKERGLKFKSTTLRPTILVLCKIRASRIYSYQSRDLMVVHAISLIIPPATWDVETTLQKVKKSLL